MKLTEKQLIGRLQELRQIKPEKEWVNSAKTSILGQNSGFYLFPFFKPALASLILAFFAFGVFNSAQNSVPGDFLYSVKKMAEKSQAVFVSKEEKPSFNLNLVTKRLEELSRIAESNSTKNMASAINEVKESVSRASRDLSGPQAINLDPVILKNIVDKMEDKMQTISSYSVIVGGEEEFGELRKNSDRLYAEYLISDLEKRTLTEDQEDLLQEMKELAAEKMYSEVIILHSTGLSKSAVIEPEEDLEEEIKEEDEIDGLEEDLEEESFPQAKE